jgi:hypothetical protein
MQPARFLSRLQRLPKAPLASLRSGYQIPPNIYSGRPPLSAVRECFCRSQLRSLFGHHVLYSQSEARRSVQTSDNHNLPTYEIYEYLILVQPPVFLTWSILSPFYACHFPSNTPKALPVLLLNTATKPATTSCPRPLGQDIIIPFSGGVIGHQKIGTRN